MSAGRNTPAATYEEVCDQKTGAVTLRKDESARVIKDGHGNARGNQYDLAVDGVTPRLLSQG